MAKGGPVISVGPTIASSRGGASLGIRVGGIEGGRSAPLSAVGFETSRGASLTNFLKHSVSITRRNQIGFKTSAKPGMESIKSLVPLRFSIRGENQARSQRVPEASQAKPASKAVNVEPVKARPEVRPGAVIIKTVERPADKGFIEQYVLAHRLRANLTRLTVPGVRTGPAISPETSTAVKTQVQPRVGTALETGTRTVVGTASNPKTEAGRSGVNPTGKVREGDNVYKNSDLEERRKRRYLKVDEDTNSLRLTSLKEALRRLQGVNPEEGIRGSDLIKAAEITAKRFRSKLLRQLGLENREDGSAHQLGENLSAIQSIDGHQLEREVERNNAVEKTDRPSGNPASHEEAQKVLTLPKSPPESMPAVLLAEQIEVVEVSGQSRITDPDSITKIECVSQIITEPKPAGDLKGSDEVLNSVIPTLIPRGLLDMEEYIINSNEVFKRRQLILAA